LINDSRLSTTALRALSRISRLSRQILISPNMPSVVHGYKLISRIYPSAVMIVVCRVSLPQISLLLYIQGDNYICFSALLGRGIAFSDSESEPPLFESLSLTSSFSSHSASSPSSSLFASSSSSSSSSCIDVFSDEAFLRAIFASCSSRRCFRSRALSACSILSVLISAAVFLTNGGAMNVSLFALWSIIIKLTKTMPNNCAFPPRHPF
jgi:hypothetical protein